MYVFSYLDGEMFKITLALQSQRCYPLRPIYEVFDDTFDNLGDQVIDVSTADSGIGRRGG